MNLPDDHYSGKRYAYVYMHYPSIRVLCNYAEAGCNMCTLLRSSLEFCTTTRLDKPGMHPESTIYAAESDDDASIDIDLSELTTPENLRERWNFKHIRSRRITLRHFSDEETGPRGSLDHFDIEVLALSHDHTSNIRGFKHSRGSMLHDDIITLVGDANA